VATKDDRFHFRDIFTASAGGETVRAFLVFGALLLLLLAIAGQLAFREVGLTVLTNRLEQIRQEAQAIADTVTRIGREGDSIDFSRVRRNEALLRNFIYERLAQRFVIRNVEIIDRFGVRQLSISGRGARPSAPQALETTPVGWPSERHQMVRVPLGLAEGEVRVGLFSAPVLNELEQIQRSLRIKVGVAAALALAVLVAGLFYVLYLIRKNRDLEQARLSAARASYVGLLASGLAHEIRNPLNAMNMNLQMLEEELQAQAVLDQEDWNELLESTKTEIKRLESLVNNFLAYARPSRPNFDNRDLNDVVGEVVRFLEADFRQSQVELIMALEPLLPTVEIDETQFKQALINLLVNARQVLDRGGHVTVRTRAGAGGEVVLEVQDDGPGIPADVQERIFEVFFSSRGGGTGLGLPIARQIVERHGGTIELDSALGRGATFRIRLPRRHAQPVPSTDEHEAQP
jgi:signal transduction histidine kinase